MSDDGSPASNCTLRSLTRDFASRHGAVAIYAMGSHDQRAGFRAAVERAAEPPIRGISPEVVFDLGALEVAHVSQIISATGADRSQKS
ncbi:hypothetical protein NHF46_14780 [Arthrobacter alpinus]|nr:hypothetical protein [Arthrobacter alpinus]